ncbi:MAG: hypothetical protein K0S23_909 [Fluviicola sp.]|jgi:hypothetical protein|uniref:T9SS type A sorting domain-containing protein n=1 Tax=Fluviicola sp. TaxID=1917219 RepID=UPI0026222229|nr:T9SS type A sorting domain-containing protein [Fluviicola sp.]MDF3026602.1 hypothetical protein [Fluviicola sp.]
MRGISYFILSTLLILSFSSFSQSNWQHVGPVSTNQQNGNLFETSQVGIIEVDPLNSNHLFAGGPFAGLWESFDDGANWTTIEASNAIGSNGISTITFISSSEILVSNAFVLGRLGEVSLPGDGRHHGYSTGIYKYNFVTDQFTACGALPNPNNLKFSIPTVTVHPSIPNLVFACTSMGLFRSTNMGTSWAQITTNYVENIVFVPTSVGMHLFIGGALNTGVYQPEGAMSVKRSTDNGLTFTEIGNNYSVPATYVQKGLARLCIKTTANETYVYAYALMIDTYLNNLNEVTEREKAYLHKITVTNATGAVGYGATTFIGSASGGSSGSYARMAFAYDQTNNGLWFGGMYLGYHYLSTNYSNYNVRTLNTQTTNGYVHMDIHYIKIVNSKIYVACDGGVARADNQTPFTNIDNVYFTGINNKLNVALVNGFSGTDSNPDLYAIEQQDIVNLDLFSSSSSSYVPLQTFPVWESDGPLIDKFDENYIIADQSSYSSPPHHVGYRTTTNQGVNWSALKKYYLPVAGSNSFEKSETMTDGEIGFIGRPFFQDPYRPNRIFRAKHRSGIHQYIKNPVNDTASYFVLKIWPSGIEQITGAFGIQGWGNPSAMSFSPLTKNSLHFTFDGGVNSRPSVIKYIGPDIDDCWLNHNMATYTVNNVQYPQWVTITPASAWAGLGITVAEQEKMTFHSIETSPWDPNVVYVGVYIPDHPDMKVLKYNGTSWSNYSTGIPNEDIGHSMIMDRQSNDAIYINTHRGVYYRSASSTQWEYYGVNYPKIRSAQMEINYAENTLRAGTFGRGIWKSNLYCPASPLSVSFCTNCNAGTPNNYWEGTTITINSTILNNQKRIIRGSESIVITPGKSYTLLTPDNNVNNYYLAFIHGCNPDLLNSFKMVAPASEESDSPDLSFMSNPDEQDIKLYPNPNGGVFKIDIDSETSYAVVIYNSMGQQVFHSAETRMEQFEVNVADLENGVYFIRCFNATDSKSASFIKQ